MHRIDNLIFIAILVGRLPLAEIARTLAVERAAAGELPYAAGFILGILGRLPASGDTARLGGSNLEVAALDALSIRRLLARCDPSGQRVGVK